MNIKRIVSQILDENCYILSNRNKCIIIDPGPGVYSKAKEYIIKNRLKLEAILFTHGHFDHTWDTQDLIKEFSKIPIYCNKNDKYFIENPIEIFDEGNLKQKINLKIGRSGTELIIPNPNYFSINDFESKNLKFDTFNIVAISLPGHSAGSTLYKINNDVFCGDIIFENSYGRTDLYLSDPVKMKNSISKILTMQKNLHFYPGHYNNFILKNWKLE